MDMDGYMNEYYKNDAKKLRGVVDKLLKKFGGINDPSEFYSLADEIFFDVMRGYDGERDFDGFLYSCLDNKIKTEMTRRNRDKRTQYARDNNGNKKKDRDGKYIILHTVYLDTPVGEDGDSTLGDTVSDKEDKSGSYQDCALSIYIESLTPKQKKIAEYLSLGYSHSEIKRKMNISEEKFKILFDDMSSSDRLRRLKELRRKQH